MEENVEILNMDYKKALDKVKFEKFDIIYLDPPYKTDFIKKYIFFFAKFTL